MAIDGINAISLRQVTPNKQASSFKGNDSEEKQGFSTTTKVIGGLSALAIAGLGIYYMVKKGKSPEGAVKEGEKIAEQAAESASKESGKAAETVAKEGSKATETAAEGAQTSAVKKTQVSFPKRAISKELKKIDKDIQEINSKYAKDQKEYTELLAEPGDTKESKNKLSQKLADIQLAYNQDMLLCEEKRLKLFTQKAKYYARKRKEFLGKEGGEQYKELFTTADSERINSSRNIEKYRAEITRLN